MPRDVFGRKVFPATQSQGEVTTNDCFVFLFVLYLRHAGVIAKRNGGMSVFNVPSP